MENSHPVVWQLRRHFDFEAPWEHVEFTVYASFDVVARLGWRIVAPSQGLHELWLVRAGAVEIEQNERTVLAQAPVVALIRSGQSRDTRQVGAAPLAIAGFSFTATIWGALDLVTTANHSDRPRRALIMMFGAPTQTRAELEQEPRSFPWQAIQKTARSERVAAKA